MNSIEYNKKYKLNLDNVLSGMTPSGQFEHLKIILSRVIENPHFGQKYLMVTPTAFGVIKLNDLDLKDGKIILQMQDAYSNLEKQFELDINDTSFKFLLISWNDVKNMVQGDKNITTDSLLELEY